ncbi:hypothetical protein GMJFJA_GMJFJA_11210, partial [Dysosmobacter welbionis]
FLNFRLSGISGISGGADRSAVTSHVQEACGRFYGQWRAAPAPAPGRGGAE